MKKIFLLLFSLISILGYSQSPLVRTNIKATESFSLGDSVVTKFYSGDLVNKTYVDTEIANSITASGDSLWVSGRFGSGADTTTIDSNGVNTNALEIAGTTIDNFTDLNDSLYLESSGIWISDKDTIKRDKSLYNYVGTGIKSGFTISINANPALVNISSGTGSIVNNSNPANPIFTPITYAGVTGLALTNLATANATYLAVNSSGTVIQQIVNFTPIQRRSLLVIGAVIHSNRTFVNAVNNLPDVSLDASAQLNDLFDALRGFNISGNVISPNGANLSINKSDGYIFKKGSNFSTSNLNPHWLNLSALTAPSNIRYRLRDGTEYSNTNVIDCDSFDNAGVRAVVPVNNYSIQRIYLFSSNLIRIQYGQATYGSMAAAIQAIRTEVFTVESNISDNGLLRAVLVVKRNTTSLQNTADAQFFEVDRFGSIQSAASGSGGTTNLQQAYNNATPPQITTNSTLGEIQIKRGSASDNDTVFGIVNGSGVTTASILGTGKLTSNSATIGSGADTITIGNGSIFASLNSNTFLINSDEDYLQSISNNKGGIAVYTTGSNIGIISSSSSIPIVSESSSNNVLLEVRRGASEKRFIVDSIGSLILRNSYLKAGLTNYPTAYDWIPLWNNDSARYVPSEVKEFATDTIDRLNTDTLVVSGHAYIELPHSALYRNTDLTITASQNIWYKVTGFTDKDPGDIPVVGDSIQLTAKGSYLINYTISFSGNNGEIWETGVFKNNVLEEPSQLRYTSTSDVGNMSCPVYVYSDGNDWISFRIRNTTDADDPTIRRFSAIITTQHLQQ